MSRTPTSRQTPRVALDHLAFAVSTWTDAADLLSAQLHGRWRHGLRAPQFDPCQISFGNDTRIELLAPPVSGESFVTRFLASQSRNRPHHVTFTTESIEKVLADVEAFGITPVLVSLGRPEWREAFLHPNDTGLGVLIQIVESRIQLPDDIPEDQRIACPWPEDRVTEPASIEYISVGVADLDRAVRLMCEVLRGSCRVVTDAYARIQWSSGADLLLFAAETIAGEPSRGVRSVAVRLESGPSLPYVEVGSGWSATQVLPELGVRLLFPAHLNN